MDAKNLIDFNSPSGSIKEELNSAVAMDKSATSFLNVPQSFVTGRESLFSQALFNSIDIGKESMPFDHNINMSQTSMTDSPFKMPHVNIDRQSLSFKGMSTSFEIGRESMPFNISTLDPSDIGRPSILVNKTLEFDRESLGLLNISSGKESLGILHHLPDLNSGLTTDLDTPTILLDDVGEDTNNTPNSLPSCMNKGFLLPHSVKDSVSSGSSVSSFESLKPMFNSHSYNSSEFSRIYSVGSSSSKSDSKLNLLNNAFQSSQEYLQKLRFSYGMSAISPRSVPDFDPVPAAIRNSPVLNDFRRKILSLPTTIDLNDKNETPKKSESRSGAIKKDVRKFWSAEKIKKSAPFKRRSFCGQQSFSEEDGDDNFNDSVFIEANHIAHKIANSFTGEAGIDDDLVDSTSPPEFNDIEEFDQNEEKPPPKYDKDAVLKIVAKYFPPLPDPKSDLKFSLKIRNQSNASNSNISNISNNSNKDLTANVSHTSQNSNKDNSCEHSKKSNLSKSKDAKDLLHNLSEILNNTNKSEHQKSEGQSLLNTLASILTQSPEGQPSVSMEDSGHSSFALETENDMNAPNLDKHVCYEVLDLRTSRSRSESDLASNIYKLDDLGAPMNLSTKLKTEGSYAQMSQSFNFPSTKNFPHKFKNGVQSQHPGLQPSKHNSKTSANGSASSCDGSRLASCARISFNRFKLKRASESVPIPKRGPMRALIPVETIAQHKSQDQPNKKPSSNVGKTSALPTTTPEKCKLSVPSFQNEKTSTPIAHKSKMKPMAQSTPDKPKWSYKQRSSEVTKPSLSGHHTASVTGPSVNNSNIKRPSTGSVTKGKPNVSSTSVPSRESKVGLVSGIKKTSLPLQRRYSVTETKKTVESATHLPQRRSYSTSRDFGVMSALSRVRENITKSPYYKTKLSTNNSLGVAPLSTAVNNNTRQLKTTNKSTRKPGKENKES